MAGKKGYKSQRDRRLLQDQGAGGRVAAIWIPKLDGSSVDGTTIRFSCEIWNRFTQAMGEISVWPYPPDLNGKGITVRDADGIAEIDVVITAENLFEINTTGLIGLAKVTIPAQIPAMTAEGNIQCGGLVATIYFPVACDPNITAYNLVVTGGISPGSYSLIGDLTDGEFYSEEGWTLTRYDDGEGWILESPTSELSTPQAGGTCSPPTNYEGSEGSDWDATISLPP